MSVSNKWIIGIAFTAVSITTGFAVSMGSKSNQIEQNTNNIEILRNDIDAHKSIDEKRHEEIMRALGRIEGKLDSND